MKIAIILIGIIVLLTLVLETYEHLYLKNKKNNDKLPKTTIKRDTRNYLRSTNKNYKGSYTCGLPVPEDFKSTMAKNYKTIKRVDYKIIDVRKKQG